MIEQHLQEILKDSNLTAVYVLFAAIITALYFVVTDIVLENLYDNRFPLWIVQIIIMSLAIVEIIGGAYDIGLPLMFLSLSPLPVVLLFRLVKHILNKAIKKARQ